MIFRKKFIYFDRVFFKNKIKLFIKFFINKLSIDLVRYQSIEQDLQILFKEKKESRKKNICIFDVGAFTGNSIFEFKKIFKNSFIYSFEPSFNNFNLLKKNTLNQNNIKIFNLAITNKKGAAIFYENEWGYTSSLKKIYETNYKKRLENDFKYRGVNKIKSKYKVNTTSIDQFMNDNKVDYIDILKIDTQGN